MLEPASVASRSGIGVCCPLDDAIVARAEALALIGWTHIADIPFDFERRCVCVLPAHEGRRTDANITKYVRMGTSSNFGNMLSLAAASLAIPFLPLNPVQGLLNNLPCDVSETGIALDSVDEAEILRPHGWIMAEVLRFTLVMGPLSSIFDIAIFALLLTVFDASNEVFRTAWFVESMAMQVQVVFVIRTAGPAWGSWPHPILALTSLGRLGWPWPSRCPRWVPSSASRPCPGRRSG